MITDEKDLTEKAKAVFENDPFAVNTVGIEIVEAKHNYSLCRLKVEDRHRNLGGGIMGGVLFTLADFAFSVAVNAENMNTVTVSANIDYLNSFKSGEYLYAKTKCRKDGRMLSYYRVVIKDEKKNRICECQFVGYKIS